MDVVKVLLESWRSESVLNLFSHIAQGLSELAVETAISLRPCHCSSGFFRYFQLHPIVSPSTTLLLSAWQFEHLVIRHLPVAHQLLDQTDHLGVTLSGILLSQRGKSISTKGRPPQDIGPHMWLLNTISSRSLENKVTFLTIFSCDAQLLFFVSDLPVELLLVLLFLFLLFLLVFFFLLLFPL